MRAGAPRGRAAAPPRAHAPHPLLAPLAGAAPSPLFGHVVRRSLSRPWSHSAPPELLYSPRGAGPARRPRASFRNLAGRRAPLQILKRAPRRAALEAAELVRLSHAHAAAELDALARHDAVAAVRPWLAAGPPQLFAAAARAHYAGAAREARRRPPRPPALARRRGEAAPAKS